MGWNEQITALLVIFICSVFRQVAAIDETTCEGDSLLEPQFYFQGYCYKFVPFSLNWKVAEAYCDDEDKGSRLVSIHSMAEITFLINMLHSKRLRNINASSVWIGLNTIRDRVLKWSDKSPVNFTFWNTNEPNNAGDSEKCCSMHSGNGRWNDENCRLEMRFICKQAKNNNDSHIILNSIFENCKKGWYAYGDRCYLPVGYAEKDRGTWHEASTVCEDNGGYLVSIRGNKEQAFLSYLMQGLQMDTWIGFYARTPRKYYWLDDSFSEYTNWVEGQPDPYRKNEDCVKMFYYSIDSGEWLDDECNNTLPFICYQDKDPNVPVANYTEGLNCMHPPGWLKLGDDMCFKLYSDRNVTWEEAEAACRMEGAHLISISGTQVQAVAHFLGMKVRQKFWIGLNYRKDSQKFEWLNGHPVSIGPWETNEPFSPTASAEPLCYANVLTDSWTMLGRWKRLPCQEKLPYICQTSPVPVRQEYIGNCPNSSEEWKDTQGSFCYLYQKEENDWLSALTKCFENDSHLISFHSFEDLKTMQKIMKPETRSVYIGLYIRIFGWYYWSDFSPVDFINWDEGEPRNGRCVEMMTDTLKWRTIDCNVKKTFICSYRKEQLVNITAEEDNSLNVPDNYKGLSVVILVGIIACSFIVLFVIVSTKLLLCPTLRKRSYRNRSQLQCVSYKKTLHNVDEAN